MNEPLDGLLSAIERQELRSLVWGHVDGSTPESDVLRLAAEFSDAPQGLVDELVRRALLLEVGWDREGLLFRSRFAEATRLLARIRQISPWNSWDTAPQLVADYRIDARPRQYPRRDVPAAEVTDALRGTTRWDGFREHLWAEVTAVAQLRLSRFQLDAARAVHDWPDRTQALVVTAGTGSGKTLAYYLPVLVEVSALVRDRDYWTKSVSIYPRVELLKDQFSEVFRLAVTAFPLAGGRRLRFGALYGGVPRDAEAFDDPKRQRKSWPRRGAGYECPFLRCPTDHCDGRTIWLDGDRRGGREVLTCDACGRKLGKDGELSLTRASLVDSPPDLLFTSAEMVNQRLSDPRLRSVLGAPPRRDLRARFLLLDEIHTYNGVLGAQIGSVVRRWRHAVGRPVLLAGLSATLVDAAQFMGDLVGVPSTYTTEIRPRDEDLAEAGMAYQLVLRADAAARTAVLSTTIQAAFLMARMLDSAGLGLPSSGGAIGSRLFVFSDTLDVTNRLFDNLKDAERSILGRPLAALRANPSKDRQKDLEGQDWSVPEMLRGSLDTSLRVSRTSSQDVGVDSTSDIVIATASLEVGYNDPSVGAVIQHRAPHDHATFLQRRGRAGRSLEMRPWMVTILSEYGRDRAVFRQYEQLIEPVLERLKLPIRNRYVQRIQATHALIDWLSLQVPNGGWARALLDGPKSGNWRQSQAAVMKVLDEALAGDAARLKSLRDHVIGALGISDDDADAVLWAPPRSLVLEVVPTLRRRLATNWVTATGEDLHQDWHPLPDFLPAALFSDLSLPEVAVAVPFVPAEHAKALLPAGQALRELAPGRVTRRFAVRDDRPFDPKRPALSHWLSPFADLAASDSPPGTANAEIARINIDTWMREAEVAGTASVDGNDVTIYRPWQVQVSATPEDISPTSHGSLDWMVEFNPVGGSAKLNVPRGAGVSGAVDHLQVFLHAQRSPVTVFRYALSGHASIRRIASRIEESVHYRFQRGTEPAGLGFALEVDGIRAPIQVPDSTQLADLNSDPRRAGQLGEYFRMRVAHQEGLPGRVNSYEIQWLADAALMAVALEAAAEGASRSSAIEAVCGDIYSRTRQAVDLMLTAGIGVPGDDSSGAPGTARDTRLGEDVRKLLEDPAVLGALGSALQECAAPGGPMFDEWLRGQYINSVASAFLSALWGLLPDGSGAEALEVDVVHNPQPEVWITESTLGGGGTIEAIAAAFARDPWRFARSFDAVISPSESEVLAVALSQVASLVSERQDIHGAAANVRVARTHGERETAQRAFNALLASAGVAVDRALSVSIAQRLMRPGAGQSFDRLVHRIDQRRHQIDSALGFTLDLRLMALVLATDGHLSGEITAELTALRGSKPTFAQTAAVLGGILWPGPAEYRKHALEVWSPYWGVATPDPGALRILSTASVVRLQVSEKELVDRAAAQLASRGAVEVCASTSDLTRLSAAVESITTSPVAFDFLRLYPSLAALTQDGPAIVARLEVRELA